MNKQKTQILVLITSLLLIAIAVSVTTSGLLSAEKTLPATGIVSSVDISVYTDISATKVCLSINWRNLNPGDIATRLYIKNNGNIKETLHMTASGWNPSSANSSLTLSWDKEGVALAQGSVIAATLTLKVAQDPGSLSDFSFNVILQGTA